MLPMNSGACKRKVNVVLPNSTAKLSRKSLPMTVSREIVLVLSFLRLLEIIDWIEQCCCNLCVVFRKNKEQHVKDFTSANAKLLALVKTRQLAITTGDPTTPEFVPPS